MSEENVRLLSLVQVNEAASIVLVASRRLTTSTRLDRIRGSKMPPTTPYQHRLNLLRVSRLMRPRPPKLHLCHDVSTSPQSSLGPPIWCLCRLVLLCPRVTASSTTLPA